MHHALEIVEVVEIICGHVAPSVELRRRKDLDADDWHKNLKKERALALDALSQFARTSTVFLNPALNALWSYQGTIVNLLRVMRGAWLITEKWDAGCEEQDVAITQLRPLTASDRDRFLFYARRVKSFSLDDEGFLKPPQIYDSLGECIHAPCILPHLQRLDWSPANDELVKHVQLFLSPAITHLTANIISSSEIPMLNMFTLGCPNVTHLTVWADGETPQAILPISKLVCALPRLQFLDVPGLDARALVHIARLPTIRHLRLTADVAPLPSLMPLTESPDHFPALTHLEHYSPYCTPALLQTMLQCPLTEFKFWSHIAATNSVVAAFISTLSHHCEHRSLQYLCLQIKANPSSPLIDTNELESYLVGEEILKPLFSFGNLVSVQLEYAVGFDIDDGVIRNMARAWPRLEALVLPHHHPYHLPLIRVTLGGVHSLADYCPLLEELTISFDATAPPPKIKRSSRVYGEKLWYLDVADSPIRTTRPVAKFLHAIFPCLDNIRTFKSTHTTSRDPQLLSFHRVWKKVVAILQELND
ncbi:hypothetical protein B0H16DRAFT_1892637 [Mycena metata]|uniref:F-box domain-containing protein n=1 Tax=Mycena metata TaxID=1033252 RepID=A0AAD7I2Y2_9AGAR|nr:hypothetical protein B0H16DRAFT_1892637 [Mycena metata]